MPKQPIKIDHKQDINTLYILMWSIISEEKPLPEECFKNIHLLVNAKLFLPHVYVNDTLVC